MFKLSARLTPNFLTHRLALPLALIAALPLAAAQVQPQSIVVNAAGPAVTGLTLIDADSNQPVKGYDPVPGGAVLDLRTLPAHLNVRANTAGKIGSVRFGLDGNASLHTENGAPYALCADNKGDYPACPSTLLSVGQHSLSATPFAGSNGSGQAGAGVIASFSVIRSAAPVATPQPTPAPSVLSLTLINTDTNQPVQGYDPIPAGAVLKRSSLPRNLNVRVNVGGPVRSLVFTVDGRTLRPENEAPFALCSDTRLKDGKKGQYLACDAATFAPGKHTATFTPYSEMFGKGTRGPVLTWNYTVEK